MNARPRDHLLRSAYSLVANVVLTSAFGVGFWVAAARLFPAASVGRDAALVAAMTAVSTICTLNLSSVLVRFLPISRLSPSRVVLAAYVLTGGVSAAGGVAFVLIAPRVAGAYAFLHRDAMLAALWVAAVIAWGVFTLQDAVLTALRRAPWVPLENGAFGALKFAALPILLAAGSAHAVFIAWVIPMIALLIPVNYAIFVRFIPVAPPPAGESSPVQQFGWSGLARFAAGDYLAMVLVQASSTLLPALVLALVGSRDGAYFYMPFTIVATFDALVFSVLTSVTVEAALAPERLGALVVRAARRFGWLLAAGVLVLVAAAPLVLAPFGAGYVHGGRTVLVLMACACPLRALGDVYAAICRARGRTGPILALQTLSTVLIAGLTVLLAGSDRLTGVGLAWLIASAVAALFTIPTIAGTVRGPRRSPQAQVAS